jgi:hypothetical protein
LGLSIVTAAESGAWLDSPASYLRMLMLKQTAFRLAAKDD